MNLLKITTFTNNQNKTFKNTKNLEVVNPSNGKPFATVEFTPVDALDEIIVKAAEAQKAWAQLTAKKRAEIFFNYHYLLKKHREELATLIHQDNGKTMLEALGEVDKCIELTEFACSIPQIATGEIQKVSKGIFCREELRPIGVCAVITPFNFPLMVPHWSIPNALVLGNAVILKPSELTPVVTQRFGELLTQAGLPANLYNVVHGDAEIATALAKNDKIQGLTFVGSTRVAKIVYQEAVANNKRALCLGGAKNHVFVLNDADPKIAAKEVLTSAVGMAGQRCMAISVALVVGDNPEFDHELVTQAKNYKLGKNLPPIVSLPAIQSLKDYVKQSLTKKAQLLVDGEKDFIIPQENQSGFWFGPTILDWSQNHDGMTEHEVFGPILEVLHFKTLKEAIAFQNKSPYGNSVAVYTQSARAAEEVIANTTAGMMGINIGVAVPREPFSFGGLNLSKFGYGDITGKSSISFWTNLVKVSSKWNPEFKIDWMS